MVAIARRRRAQVPDEDLMKRITPANADPERLGEGDFNELLQQHRDRLKRVVQLRLDARVRARTDSSDIVQEVLIEAARRSAEYAEAPRVPFFVWLRMIAMDRIVMSHRKHLGAEMRSVAREQPLCHADLHSASHELSMQLSAGQPTPSSEAARSELRQCVHEVLTSLNDVDREIVLLRHFEQMDNAEVASALGMNPSTTSSRYVRALAKLRKELSRVTDFP
jgi:RNA polymerase sigma-70 factor (ECF subfamily)